MHLVTWAVDSIHQCIRHGPGLYIPDLDQTLINNNEFKLRRGQPTCSNHSGRQQANVRMQIRYFPPGRWHCSREKTLQRIMQMQAHKDDAEFRRDQIHELFLRQATFPLFQIPIISPSISILLSYLSLTPRKVLSSHGPG